MTDTTSSPAPTPTAPTPQEIEAAARILMRAWAPGYLLPGDQPKDIVASSADDYDEDDPDDYCGCAGTDDDGESLGCNCGPGCVCDECSYWAYSRYKRCWVKGCAKTPAFRVVRFGLVDQHVQEPTKKGAVCPHPEGADHWCTPDTVYVAAGPSVQEFSSQPACSIAHAVQLRDADQRPDRDGRDLYRIEAWTYSPHDRELPAPLPRLREETRSARDAASLAIQRHAALGGPGYWLESVRRHLALAAWNARLEVERPGEDHDVWDDQPSTPPQEEPTEPDTRSEAEAAAVHVADTVAALPHVRPPVRERLVVRPALAACTAEVEAPRTGPGLAHLPPAASRRPHGIRCPTSAEHRQGHDMSAPARTRKPSPADIARRKIGSVAAAPQAPVEDTTSSHAVAPVAEAPAEESTSSVTEAVTGERPTEPRPMYEPRKLTAEEAIAPGVLTDTEYFRSVFRWCLTHSGLPAHTRLLAHDLLHRANHKNGRLGSAHQPDIAHLALATGLSEAQIGVALQVLHSRGWIAYRTDIPEGTRRLYDLVIPALELERARGRRFLQQQE